mmetsp:Transcript_5356/g.8271  ORF Transcript_5356/g.8271 Transcript_5356/m.8271 type:complete len:220 (+) Transcript_5356:3813-4472(+)
MVSTRADSCQRVNDDLDVLLLALLHDPLQALGSSEHAVGPTAVGGGQRRGIVLPELGFVVVGIGEWVVVPLKSAHQIESRDSLTRVVVNVPLDVGKGASLHELVLLLVDLGVLVVNLHFVEAVFSHATRVYNESALGDAAYLFFDGLLIVVIVGRGLRFGEDRRRLTNNLQRLELAVLAEGDEPPVVEPALPELAEVNRDLDLNIIFADNVARFDFMPS